MPIVNRIPPPLRFDADETMLQLIITRKVLVPENFEDPITPETLPIPLITALCCANVFGDKMQLFIILPLLVKTPAELIEFQERGHAIFASSSNCWQTRDTFVFLSFVLLILCYFS